MAKFRDRRVVVELAEGSAEGDLLLGRELLAAKQQDQMLAPCGAKLLGGCRC
jgi:hypothetical protein